MRRLSELIKFISGRTIEKTSKSLKEIGLLVLRSRVGIKEKDRLPRDFAVMLKMSMGSKVSVWMWQDLPMYSISWHPYLNYNLCTFYRQEIFHEAVLFIFVFIPSLDHVHLRWLYLSEKSFTHKTVLTYLWTINNKLAKRTGIIFNGCI